MKRMPMFREARVKINREMVSSQLAISSVNSSESNQPF